MGFVGVQIPSWDRRLFDLKVAAESRDYCEEVLGILDAAGLKLTELSTHLQGQLIASNPAYDTMLDGFAPDELKGRPKEQQAGADRTRHFFRRFGVAVFLSMAAAAGGID